MNITKRIVEEIVSGGITLEVKLIIVFFLFKFFFLILILNVIQKIKNENLNYPTSYEKKVIVSQH